MATSSTMIPCLVKKPISTIYRDGKAVDPQPMVGRTFNFTEREMLAITKANPKAIETPKPANVAASVKG